MEWYERLRRSGFVDIETEDGGLVDRVRKRDALVVRGLAAGADEYFRLAGRFLLFFRFSTDVHRRCWELHAEGLNAAEIHRAIHGLLAHDTVAKIVARHRRLMLAGGWDPEEEG